MEKKNYSASIHYFTEAEDRSLSSGKYYMMLYISKGNCYFETEEKMHFCTTEDAIIIKPGEKVAIHFKGGNYPLEILTLRILPEYLRELSDDVTDLEQGFLFAPFKVSVIRIDSEEAMLMKNIARKLSSMNTDEAQYGHLLYEKSLISMLLVLSLRACIKADKVSRSKRRKNILMDDIFIYIRDHLTEDLSLEQLEKTFFVSRYHICREFKRLTGQTPHAYIIKARLDLCRKYIEQGMSIHEVYQLGGFGGYNHFFRAFKKEYGITPMEYYRSLNI